MLHLVNTPSLVSKHSNTPTADPLFCSFNHLMCPEPGCEYVARRREEIQSHMATDHVDSSSEEVMSSPAAVSLLLFLCPACDSHLELKAWLPDGYS